MTSDAKIGLLLALIFIVAIAFVINGLPLFSESKTKTEPQKDYFDKYKYAEPGLVGSARKVAPTLNKTISLKRTTYLPKPEVRDTIRYEAILPKANEIVETTGPEPEPTATKTVVPILLKTTKTVDVIPRQYVVQPGDNLADIAKKFYGEELGNKLINVEKIFKANSKVLKSQDELSVGQKLVIPPLDFETMIKISQMAKNSTAEPKTFREYTVQEDDSLWEISDKLLGNGGRYKEIVKLNTDTIKNENNLTVGTKLRLPIK